MAKQNQVDKYEVPAILHKGHHYVTLKIAEKFLHQIPFGPQENILEVGCRDGKISTILALMNPHCELTSLTTTQEYLKQIQENKTIQSLENINFSLSDLYHFDYPNQFDKVLSFSCLTWFEDKKKILQNIYSSLKPGKKAYLQFFVDHKQEWFDNCRLKVATSSKWESHFKNFKIRRSHPTAGEVVGMAEQIGFIIEKSDLRRHQIMMPNEDYFKNWLKSISAHFIELLQDKSDAFFNDASKVYLDQHPKDALGQVCYEDYFIELVLLKPA